MRAGMCVVARAHLALKPFSVLESEGASSPDGRVRGCYLHGLFAGDAFRAAYLRDLGAAPSGTGYDAGVEATLDALAGHLEAALDLDRLLALAAAVPGG